MPVCMLRKLEKESRLTENLTSRQQTGARVWSGNKDLPMFVTEVERREEGSKCNILSNISEFVLVK